MLELTQSQIQQREAFRTFVDEEVMPYADKYDQEEQIPAEVINKLSQQGFLGSIIPAEYSGAGMDMLTFGLLCKELGRGSSSLLSLLTVHAMLCQSILKWGSATQRKYWLPKLAAGEALGAFALTEPQVGSDAKSVETKAVREGNAFVLNGRKKWITFGQKANLFLIIAQCDEKPSAFLVEKSNPGIYIKPIQGMLGFRASMLAEVIMEGCAIPEENLVGQIGFGFSHVVGSALDLGRFCVGWGCVGLAQACLEASLRYSNERKQFGTFLREHQLIQQMIADMIVNIKAAELLCCNAAKLRDLADPDSIMETSISKYFASTMVVKAASDAVQIHGANGCSSNYPVQRYYRDAKIMEIIEGSNQMQQIIISKYGHFNFVRDQRKQKDANFK